jgi:hypothetical protein
VAPDERGTAEVAGVAFPEVEDGNRSTSRTGRAVVAAAARAVDPALADRIEREAAWHVGYAGHLRALVAAELRADGDLDRAARAGLDAVYERFEFVRDGTARRLDEATSTARTELGTLAVAGTGEPAPLAVPYRGQRLTGDALRRQLDAWVDQHVVEPSFAGGVHEVLDHPDWLDLTDRTVVVLGAAAEMGPLVPLSRWGATLALVDLPRPALWERVLATVREGAGRAVLPLRDTPVDAADDRAIAAVAGADLSADLPEVAAWCAALDGPLTVGGYTYADGAAHVVANLAVDALQRHLLAARDDVSLAALLTPTDAYAVPAEVVAASRERLASAGALRGLARTVSSGRAFAPQYPDDVTTPNGRRYGIADGLVLQQGPNYALAKRLQRWRLRVARQDGIRVSANVAPATRTRSVTRNRLLAAAYAGAPRFDVEVFASETSNALMAALLVRDLRSPAAAGAPETALDHPLELFAESAAHGGLWRNPFLPRSVLPLAAVLGLPFSRRGRGR